MKYSRRNLLQSISALAGATMIPKAGEASPDARPKQDMSPGELDELINLFDFEHAAKEHMSHMAYEYVASGAADEQTLRWNREMLDKLKLHPRVLKDVSKVDTGIDLFGTRLPFPILVAPTAFHRIIHPEGELATAKGAADAGALYCVSSFTTTPIEDIAKVSTGPRWFQLYVVDDRNFVRDLVQKVEAHGSKALVITVDTPVSGVRDRQKRAGFKLPDDVHAPYMIDNAFATKGQVLAFKKPLDWEAIAWLRSLTKLPVLLKGILHPADAELAIQHGASGIVVSNHGGRNLDTVPATIEVLPDIIKQVHGRIPVLMDGGIRRGTDVLKALAHGARAVLVGKPICYGLACGGAEGVTKVLNILRKELELSMALTGNANIRDVSQALFKV
jgi:4-hydroxymandelate oxidase